MKLVKTLKIIILKKHYCQSFIKKYAIPKIFLILFILKNSQIHEPFFIKFIFYIIK